MSEPVAAPKRAPLELKLRIMQRNWSYPEFREVLFKEAKEGANHKHSSVYKRIYAYLRALELHGQGLYDEIRRTIRGEIGYAPSRGRLSYWLRGLRTPLGNLTVFDVRQPEVGLVTGLVLSDGHRREHYHNGYFHGAVLRFYNTDEGLLEMFKEACRKLGIRVCQQLDQATTGREKWRLEANSALLYLLLKRYDDFMIKAPTNIQWAFIKGLMLGDGHIGCNIMLRTTDLKIIRVTSALLSIHGIKHSICGPYPPRPPGKKPIYYIYIWRRSREGFLRMTGLAESPPRPSSLAALSLSILSLIS